jgi:hypothetical protein
VVSIAATSLLGPKAKPASWPALWITVSVLAFGSQKWRRNTLSGVVRSTATYAIWQSAVNVGADPFGLPRPSTGPSLPALNAWTVSENPTSCWAAATTICCAQALTAPTRGVGVKRSRRSGANRTS